MSKDYPIARIMLEILANAVLSINFCRIHKIWTSHTNILHTQIAILSAVGDSPS